MSASKAYFVSLKCVLPCRMSCKFFFPDALCSVKGAAVNRPLVTWGGEGRCAGEGRCVGEGQHSIVF